MCNVLLEVHVERSSTLGIASRKCELFTLFTLCMVGDPFIERSSFYTLSLIHI